MISINFEKGPRKQNILIVEKPFELIGNFLTLEASGLACWPITKLLPAINSIKKHEIESFSYGGDAFNVDITLESVDVQLVVEDPPDNCVVSLEDFYSILVRWRDKLLGK